MNKFIVFLAAIGLVFVVGGCASSGGGGYGGPSSYGYYGYSQSQEDRDKQAAARKKMMSVRQLEEDARKGSDPSTTLFHQMMINKMP